MNLTKVIGLASHSDVNVRRALVGALSGRDEPLALQTLMSLMQDSEAIIRDWATFELGIMSDADSPQIRDAFAKRLLDEYREARNEALVSLAKRQDPRVIPAILRELARDDVGESAIEAAGLMPDPSFLPELEAILATNPDDDDIIAAIEACRTGIVSSV
jgi:HEAT repeat protein